MHKCIEPFTNSHSLEEFLKNNNASDLLNLPLSEFYVSTSHNSYLGNLQVLGNASPDNLLNVLNNGARCIELDVHMANSSRSTNWISILYNYVITDTTPVVSHRAGEYNIYALKDYLDIIKNNAFKTTNDPLFIYLEISDMNNEDYVKSLANIIKSTLGPLLYEGTMTLNFDIESKITELKKLENELNIAKISRSILGSVNQNVDSKIAILDSEIAILESKKIEKENIILDIIQQKFGKNEKNIESKYFINVPIKNLLNKICIVINYFNMNIGNGLSYRNKYLFPIVHGTTNEPGNDGESNSGWFKKYPISNVLFGNSNIDTPKYISNTVGRVYPYNILTSENFQFNNFINANYTFIAMNYGNTDILKNSLNEYKQFFKCSQFIPKNYMINDACKLIRPALIYDINNNKYIEYSNTTSLFPIIKTGTIYSSNFSWVNGSFRMTMENDGNLVIYRLSPQNKLIWSTKTSNNPGAKLWCQYDGNLVIYGTNNKVLWSSNTYSIKDKNSYGIFHGNGSFILYNNNGKARKILA